MSGLKQVRSTPAKHKVVLTQSEIVLSVTCLKGFAKNTKQVRDIPAERFRSG